MCIFSTAMVIYEGSYENILNADNLVNLVGLCIEAKKMSSCCKRYKELLVPTLGHVGGSWNEAVLDLLKIPA